MELVARSRPAHCVAATQVRQEPESRDVRDRQTIADDADVRVPYAKSGVAFDPTGEAALGVSGLLGEFRTAEMWDLLTRSGFQVARFL